MINSVNFGGLGKPVPTTAPLVAPTPVEYATKPEQNVKNVNPKQIDEQ